MNNTNLFKILAITEGISFLLILFITMPLKYFADMPMPNKIVGMAHGFLFIAYVVMVFMVKNKFKWTKQQTMLALLASIIPFGTFYIEKKFVPKN
ncbi:MAG: DUF3817 domain-containing protein [Chitinophagales bacterium]|nr:DUF3817 domain-containing protein [Bacteroidota bacterium]MCB9227210.1 DUF3817 domain-containing protein [Chitinophagales bacterium]